MIPELYQRRYQEFCQHVGQLRIHVAQPLTPTEPQKLVLQAACLKSEITQLQHNFRDDILSLTAIADSTASENEPARVNEVPPEIAHRLQAIQVEIDKQLKLLAMDVLFLQTARQATTAEQRQQQMGDRLEQLERYCALVLSAPIAAPSQPHPGLLEKPEP
jgi:hypothetical protein